MNTSTQSVKTLVQIVRANTTLPTPFIVTRPIFDLVTIVRQCNEQNIITSKRCILINNELTNDWVRNAFAWSDEELLFDLESRFSRVLDNMEEFLHDAEACNDEDMDLVEYMIYQFLRIARLYSTLKSRSAVRETAKDMFTNLSFQLIV
jgi:hypothetical protein